MQQFELLFAADDLAVLSAYAAAQDLAEAERRSQPQGSPAAVSTLPLENASGSADEGCEEADGESAETSAPAERRTYVWIPRLRSVEGVPPDRMAPIHGRLIAHGLLQFQLQGREEGVLYRITSAGRQKLIVPTAEAA